MVHNIIEVGRSLLQYSLQFLVVTIVQFTAFFLFALYKTGQPLQAVLSSYAQVFTRALSLTLSLLLIIVLVTTYVPMCSLSVVMLAVSSVVMLLQVFDLFREEKHIIVSMIILLANAYVIYLAITQDSLLIQHYVVLYAIALYVFLSQRFRVVYLTVKKQD